MKKIALIFVLIIFCLVFRNKVNAQVWYFNDSCGIDFNQAVPLFITSNVVGTDECYAQVCDSTGQILFYLNGSLTEPYPCNAAYLLLNNKYGIKIKNSDSLFTDQTQTQGAIAVNNPGSDKNLFYIFYLQYQAATLFSFPYGLHFSVVDMSLNNDSGAVTQKNIPLMPHYRFTEKLNAVRHGNGRDWWLLAHAQQGNSFIEFLLDPYGVQGPYIQNIGNSSDTTFYAFTNGQMKFSPNGSKLAYVCGHGYADLFDFDRCSGYISHWIKLDSIVNDSINYNPPIDKRYYGCEFSPNGNVLYIGSSDLIQYDLSSGSIPDTRTTIYHDSNSNCSPGGFEIGPDGKIYMTVFGPFNDTCNNYVGIINNPDSLGISCNFDISGLYLGGRKGYYGLPNIANTSLSALTGSLCDTLTGIKELPQENFVMQIYPNPASEEINILLSKFISSGEVKIMDITGREMRSKNINHQNEIDFSMADLPAGIYFVQLKTQDGNAVKIFVRSAN